MLKEIKKIRTNIKDLRNFGFIMFAIFFIVSAILFYYNNILYQKFALIAFFFIVSGIIIPKLLVPIYLIWMTFSLILGWIMTRIILSLVFYFIITPIGLITRLIGEDFLSLEDLDSTSYWNFRDGEKERSQNYEKQF